MSARAVALEALGAVEEGAFANLVLPKLLANSDLERRDRDFATSLVYGATRMRRALDWTIDQHVDRELEPVVRNLLRLGAFQLRWLEVPPHAAVSATVDLAPQRARGFVNAVLRRVSEARTGWPDLGTELSYPDWILERLVDDLGETEAHAALRAMNEPPPVTVRADGYTQDLASQWVTAAAGALVPEAGVVLDACAAPGGKATGMASGSASLVVAADLQPHRVRLVVSNARRLGSAGLSPMVADARHPALRPACADLVLVDAPCSGLGALRRRPDARWRIQASDVDNLAALQREILRGVSAVVKPGGALVYSACTMTDAETVGIDRWLSGEMPQWQALPALGPPWREHGRGNLLLPQDQGTDAMFLLAIRRP